MNTYDPFTLDKLSEVLAERAKTLGASSFSIRDEIVSLDDALDTCGPLTWALVIHADAMTRLLGIAPQNATNTLPIICVVNPEAPFGSEAVLQPGTLPMSLTVNLLDSALEHAICLGMRAYNYAPSEWNKLPFNERIPSIEPYLQDLQENWVNQAGMLGNPAELLNAWPSLFDHDRLEALMRLDDQPTPEERHRNTSRALNFPSMR